MIILTLPCWTLITRSRERPICLSMKRSRPRRKYQVAIFINNNKIDTRDVTFNLVKDPQGTSTLQPCFTLDELKSLGIKTQKYPQLRAEGQCADLHAIPSASATFRVRNQQLLLSIPQKALGQVPRGYIDPKEFDEGINAGLLNYSVNASQSHARQQGEENSSSQYVNLRPGFNIGAWRVRNYSTGIAAPRVMRRNRNSPPFIPMRNAILWR